MLGYVIVLCQKLLLSILNVAVSSFRVLVSLFKREILPPLFFEGKKLIPYGRQ